MNIPHISTGAGETFFLDGKPISITTINPRYTEISEALNKNDEPKLRALLKMTDEQYLISKVQESTEQIGSLVFKTITRPDSADENVVLYKGRKLAECLTQKLISLWKNGVTDFSYWTTFVDKLWANPSHRAQNELYRFLSYAELPINEAGNFIAYKGVDFNMISYHGNVDTRVISGERLSDGRIKNNIGDVIQVEVADVDDDCNNYCSVGLHVGSYDYATSFAANGIVVAVEVDPRDVVSVPKDCNAQKCRVSKYRVLNVVKGIFNSPDVTIDEVTCTVKDNEHGARPLDNPGITALTAPDKILNTREAISRNIQNHAVIVYDDGTLEVITSDDDEDINKTVSHVVIPGTTISQLCASVGRKHNVTRAAMLNLLLRLGYNIKKDEKYLGNSIVTE